MSEQHQYKAGEYWKNIFREEVDAKSVCYPHWPLSYNRFLHRQQAETFTRILATYKIGLAQKSILEIGPGSGFWTEFFHRSHARPYTGIDISDTVIQKLCSQYPDFQFIQRDIGDASVPPLPQKADLAFSAMVLLHITDNTKFEQAFSFIADQLKAGGYFILLDAIASHRVFGAMKLQADGPDFDPAFHNKIRFMDNIQNLAAGHNLEILDLIPAFNTSQMCFDFHTRLGYLIWGKLFYAIHRRILHNAGEGTGRFYAAIQNIFDSFLTKVLGMGMSGKWVVMRKRVAG